MLTTTSVLKFKVFFKNLNLIMESLLYFLIKLKKAIFLIKMSMRLQWKPCTTYRVRDKSRHIQHENVEASMRCHKPTVQTARHASAVVKEPRPMRLTQHHSLKIRAWVTHLQLKLVSRQLQFTFSFFFLKSLISWIHRMWEKDYLHINGTKQY